MDNPNLLKEELETYHSHLSEWKKAHLGQFVLIKKDQFQFYSSFEEGLRDGIRLYGQTGYLLKKVENGNPVLLSLSSCVVRQEQES